MSSVLQTWVSELPFMQQSVLLSAVRGPDGFTSESSVKPIIRWYRRCVMLSSLDQEVLHTPFDPRGGKFTGPSYNVNDEIDALYSDHYRQSVMASEVPKPPAEFAESVRESLTHSWPITMNRFTKLFMNDLDQYPHHYIQHLKDAAQILGYKHPDEKIRAYWLNFYKTYCKEIAVLPEALESMDKRLDDFRNKKKESNEQQAAG